MPDTFSFKQSVELLGTNPKTFKEWLRKAEINPEQVDLIDPRKKYITKEQLRVLARLHGRTLPAWIDEETEPQPTMTVEAIAEQVTTFQQQITQRFDQVDRVWLQLLPLVQEILSKLHELQAMGASLPTWQQTSQRFDQLEQSLLQTLQEIPLHQQTTDAHSNGTQKQEAPEPTPAQQASAPGTLTRESTKQKTSPTKHKTSSQKKKSVRGKRLPRGLVLLRDFAGQHHVEMNRASAAGKSGKITVSRGKWLVNHRWATEALDAQGQHDFYTVFHGRGDFTRCEQCPHPLN
jgi:hypothetical protein